MSRLVLSHWGLRALGALSVSLALLLGCAVSPMLFSGARTENRIIPGRDLILSDAVGEPREAGLRVQSTPSGRRARAFLSGLGIDAASYDEMEIAASFDPGTSLFFLWSTADDLGEVHGVPLPRAWGHLLSVRLASRPQWKGTVAGVGIGWTGPLDAPFTIDSLTLRRSTPRSYVRTLLSEWTAFEGLSGHSMNFVIGGSTVDPPRIRPVPAAAAWVAAAIVLYLLAARLRRWPREGRVVLAIVLAGWILLDARWQLDLGRELRLTEERYAGKSWEEKRLAAEDGELFRFAMEVKRRLPEAPQVVFLVTREPEGADRYLALRARFHLLPHNVCSNYWYPPMPREIRKGDFLLVFQPRPDVAYDERTGTLYWNRGSDAAEKLSETSTRLPVEPVFSSGLAALYRRR